MTDKKIYFVTQKELFAFFDYIFGIILSLLVIGITNFLMPSWWPISAIFIAIELGRWHRRDLP